MTTLSVCNKPLSCIATSILTVCSIVLITVFASCKKDSKPASELIVGKWNVTSQYYYLHVGGQNTTQPLDTDAGSYYDFKTDGKVTIQMGESGTVEYNYSFKSDKEVLFTKEGSSTKLLNIISIGTGNLTLSERQGSSGNGDYSDARIDFSK